MNWSLVVKLSGFGAVMAVATVFAIPSKIEPFCWLAIFVACAIVIAKYAPGRFFLHGLCTSLVNCVWITLSHFALFEQYAAGHPDEIAQSAGLPGGSHIAMLYTGPVIGVVSGLVLGLFCFIASKLVKPAAAQVL